VSKGSRGYEGYGGSAGPPPRPVEPAGQPSAGVRGQQHRACSRDDDPANCPAAASDPWPPPLHMAAGKVVGRHIGLRLEQPPHRSRRCRPSFALCGIGRSKQR
jgi:hypothetical protein